MEHFKSDEIKPLPEHITREQAAALNRSADNVFSAIKIAERVLKEHPEISIRNHLKPR